MAMPSVEAGCDFTVRDHTPRGHSLELFWGAVAPRPPVHGLSPDPEQEREVAASDDSQPGIIKIPVLDVVDDESAEKRRRDNPV